jgi:hypothetical protein
MVRGCRDNRVFVLGVVAGRGVRGGRPPWNEHRCQALGEHQKWLDDVVAHCENKITVDFPISECCTASKLSHHQTPSYCYEVVLLCIF